MIETLEGTKETVHFEGGTILKLHDNDEAESYPMHWHLPIEIAMPVINRYGIRCGKTLYDLREEDILLMQPGVLHECIAPEHGRRFFCQLSLPASLFSSKMLSSICLALPPVMLVTPELDKVLHGQVCHLLYETYRKDAGSALLADFTKYLHVLQIVHLIYAFFEKNSTQRVTWKAHKLEAVAQLQQVCAYIQESYAECITLDSVSRKVGFSKYHFTRLFRAYTGETFYRYLNTIRITNAQTMLTDPETSITDVAYSVGYSSMSSFIRMFKDFCGCTPSRYRRMLEPEKQRSCRDRVV